MSRRDFLRFAGIAGVALPAGSIKNPDPSHAKAVDLSDEAGRPPRPWWVRVSDHPTTEIDWDIKQRYNAIDSIYGRNSKFADYVGEERASNLEMIAAENELNRLQNDIPGYKLKDYALFAAQRHDIMTNRSFLGPRTVPTPQDRGVPIWNGSREENARILRVAMRQFGASQVSFVELDERTRKLIYSHDRDGKEIVFEDVDEAYETDTKRVIPKEAKWAISYSVQMSTETIKRAPTMIAAQSTMLSYARAKFIQNRTQEFLHGLGYQCMGQQSINSLGAVVGFGVLAGLGELSRSNRLITPEYGPMVRVFMLITDLPVVPDKPIDAGIMQFCKTCKKCAEACPAGALSLDDEPTYQVRGPWNSPGHKAYFEDSVRCFTYWREGTGNDCSICLAVCPFAKKDKAWIHQWVKAGVSIAPALDGFFRSMDDAFSYGARKDPEEWWHLNLPEFGIDTEQTV